MSRDAVATIVATGLAVYGAGSVAGRAMQLHDLWEGVVAAAVDPGFTISHTLSIPLAAFLLLRRTPVSVLSAAWRRSRFQVSLLGVVLFGASTFFVWTDARGAVCSRPSTPEMFAAAPLRECLLYFRKVQRGTSSNPPSGCSLPRRADDPGAVRSAYLGYIHLSQAGGCRYWRDASAYAIYGAVGSTIAIWLVTWIEVDPIVRTKSGAA